MISTLIREPARIAAMRATPDGLLRLRARASALVLQCQKYPPAMHHHWEAIQRMADDSVWPIADLKPYFSLLLSMTDVCLGATEAVHEGLEEAQAHVSDLSTLDDVANSLRSLRSEASAVWEWMAAPPARRVLRTTPEIRAGIARGEYQTLEEAIAEANGNLPETP